MPVVLDEKVARERFFAVFSAAASQPDGRAQAVWLLRGLREPESLRVMVGLLGDGAPEVRRNACRLMAETPDPRGYFVKPLIGALRDQDLEVRSTAAEAMGAAKVKSQAVKVLVALLADAAAETSPPAGYVVALHRALKRLTGAGAPGEATARELAKFWMEWWSANRDALAQADQVWLQAVEHKGQPATPAPTPPAKDVPKKDKPEPDF